MFMSASEKDETGLFFKVQAAYATFAATTAKQSRFRGS
jgi:hypothetical protein